MKKIIALIVALSPIYSFGQINEAKMETDLSVAKSTFQTVVQSIQGDFSNSHLQNLIQSYYVKGFGVILNLPAHEVLYRSFFRHDGRRMSADIGSNSIIRESETEENKRENFTKHIINQEKITIEAFKIFLVDYASLISQLEDNEKIILYMISSSGPLRVWGSEYFSYEFENNPYYITGEISKSILDDLKFGKLSRDQALKTIEISKNDLPEAPNDIEELASVLNNLYKDDSSKTFWSTGMLIRYTPKIGVIFEGRFYSSRRVYANGEKIFNMPTIGKTKISQNERDKSVNDFYPKFLNDLKSNILDYGKTIQSLNSDELLLIEATFDDCEGCNIPEKIEISLKADVLSKYNSGELSKEKAASQIGIVEIGKQ